MFYKMRKRRCIEYVVHDQTILQFGSGLNPLTSFILLSSQSASLNHESKTEFLHLQKLLYFSEYKTGKNYPKLSINRLIRNLSSHFSSTRQ